MKKFQFMSLFNIIIAQGTFICDAIKPSTLLSITGLFSLVIAVFFCIASILNES